jgi:diacylglycerol kinase family enzyme
MDSTPQENANETTAEARPRSFQVLLGTRSGRPKTNERRVLEAVLGADGRPHEIRTLEDPSQLRRLAREAAQRAAAESGAVVALGGDGTIGAVAAEALRENCLFGVIPGGTYNYFARAHGISEDTEEAARQLVGGRPHPVQVGLLNGRVFLVNASVGLYPELFEEREQLKARFGRSRLVALGATLVTLVQEHRQLLLEFVRDGVVERRRTPTLVVENNRLQMEQVGLEPAEALDLGLLPAVTLEPMGTWGLFRLLLRGAFGALGSAPGVHTFVFRRLEVRPGRRYGRHRLKVGLDGEVAWERTPLVFEVAKQRLRLLLPEPSAPTGTAP